MKVDKIIGIVLIIGIIVMLWIILDELVFSVKLKPEPINSEGKEVSYNLEENGNKLICTKTIYPTSLYMRIFYTRYVKSVTTYEFENDEVTSAECVYYFAREDDAKNCYETMSKIDFFANDVQVSKNILTENLTDIYKGKSKEDIKDNIKENYKI